LQKIKTYKDFIEIASLFFALLIAFWIPELKFILSYFIGLWLLLTISQLNFRKRFKQNLNTRFKKFIFFSQLILFLIIFSELLFAKNTTEVSKNITQKLSFLLFPILFSLSGNKFKQKQYLFLKLFVVSNLIASVFCLLLAFYNSSSFVDGHYVFNPVIIKGWQYYFLGSNFTFFHHRGYFSMYIVFSIVLIIYLYEKKIWFTKKGFKIWYLLMILFFLVIIYLLESRASIIFLFVMLSGYLIYKIFSLKIILYKVVAVILIMVIIFAVLQNRRIQMTIKKVVNIENRHIGQNTDARIVLWAAAVDLIKDNFYLGVGAENIDKKFIKAYKKYESKELKIVKDFNYNIHNQFLEMWAIYGLLGFLFLSSLFVVPVVYSFMKKNYLFLIFLFITGFNFLFESVLETIAGIVFFVYFLNYFVFVFNEDSEIVLNEKKSNLITKN